MLHQRVLLERSGDLVWCKNAFDAVMTHLAEHPNDFGQMETKSGFLADLCDEMTDSRIKEMLAIHLKDRFPSFSTPIMKLLTNKGQSCWETVTNFFRIHWRLTDASVEYCAACCAENVLLTIIKHFTEYNLFPEEEDQQDVISSLQNACISVLFNLVKHREFSEFVNRESIRCSLQRLTSSQNVNEEIRFTAAIALAHLVNENQLHLLESAIESIPTLVGFLLLLRQNTNRPAEFGSSNFKGRFDITELLDSLEIMTRNRAICRSFLQQPAGALILNDNDFLQRFSQMARIQENLSQSRDD